MPPHWAFGQSILGGRPAPDGEPPLASDIGIKSDPPSGMIAPPEIPGRFFMVCPRL
jgi:hypothetical protein